MFKKSVLGLGFLVAMSPLAAVQAANDGSGCGLGQVILEGKKGTGIHIAASILNNLVIPQTSAMSSGTMGCDTTKTVQNDERETFVAQNMDNLSVDFAQGQGDYLASLAHIMGIDAHDRDSFYRLTQNQYSELNGTSNAKDMLAQIDVAMLSDNSLAKYVR